MGEAAITLLPKVRVLLLWDADYPWDVRVEKVAGALAKQGLEVHLLARNLARRPVLETGRDLTIHRLTPLPSWAGRLNDAYTFPAFMNPVWVSTVDRLVRRLRPEVMIVRDLPLAPLAVVVGRGAGVPVLWDMAESYPEMVRNVWIFGPRKARNLLIRNPWLADLVERFVITRAHRILVVVQEARDRLLRKGADPLKIAIVSNTPELDGYPRPAARVPPDGPLHLVYVGLAGRSRGLDIAVSGLASYRARGGRARLSVAGTGAALDEIKDLAARLSLGSEVDFLGWVDPARVPALIATADMGIIPHRRCPHWDTTIPNKLFDYMAAGIPVLASDPPPMARILAATGAGVSYPDGSPDAFADAMHSLEDPAVRAEMGSAGRGAVETEYNWTADSKRLVGVVRSLMRPAALDVDRMIRE